MFKKYPREVGPPRKTVYDNGEYLTFINVHNGLKKAVYTSIYNFMAYEGKEHVKPNYNTAIIDKIFFDFDDKSCKAYEECYKLHLHLLKENIKHCVIMSGRGYHLYIFTNIYNPQNIKETIKNAQIDFINKLDLHVDSQVIGNPAQLVRVPNTFNVKGNRFCIPLNKFLLDKGDTFIKQFAEKQNFIKDIYIGEKLLDLKPYDLPTPKEEFSEIKSSSIVINKNDYPPCIKGLLDKKDVGWKGRYLLIVYFRDKGYTKQETFDILKLHLSESKLRHCIHDEGQLNYLFSRHDLTFPICERIHKDGFCPGKCNDYNEVIYKK